MSGGPEIATLRALAGAFHRAAEQRMPREGKVEPVPFPDEGAARILGSVAQAFGEAADRLEEERAQRERLLSGG